MAIYIQPPVVLIFPMAEHGHNLVICPGGFQFHRGRVPLVIVEILDSCTGADATNVVVIIFCQSICCGSGHESRTN